jgi:hypothetical protein
MRCAVHPARCRHKDFAREPPNNPLQALDAKCSRNLVGRHITGTRHLRPLVRAALVAKHYPTTMKKVDQNGARAERRKLRAIVHSSARPKVNTGAAAAALPLKSSTRIAPKR